MMQATLRPMQASDWEDVRRIYLEGIATGIATFQTEAPGWEEWDRNHLAKCRLVAEAAGRSLGWAVLAAISSRAVYRGVAEVSVYVGEDARGQGIGRLLLGALVTESERLGFWTLQAGIFAENICSLGLHKSAGFREVGRRERMGQLGGQWRDVVLVERRSQLIG